MMNIGQLRNAVASSVNVNLSIQDWLNAAAAISPSIATAVEGIHCGSTGWASEPLSDFPKYNLTYGWAYGKIEYAYIF